MQEIAEGVYRLGSAWVNWYVIRREEGVTVVDSAFPGYFDQLPETLSSVGARLSDVRAVVLTHNHSDHTGAADRIRAETGAEVYIHKADAAITRGDAKPKPPPGMLSNLWRPPFVRFMAHAAANGGARFPKVKKLTEVDDGQVLEVPGRLRAVHTPGHSPGHCALLLEESGVLFSGDGLVTRQIWTDQTGPQVFQINEDRAGAIRSLDAYEQIDASLLLPGHGEPWSGSIADAVSMARSSL
jgi:glyoxylase-like metal-dependent hydrolase (beta-lactamase superfamily II)